MMKKPSLQVERFNVAGEVGDAETPNRSARRRTARAKKKTEEIVYIEPVAVRRATAAAMLDCSESTVRKLESEGRLRTVLMGADRRVTVESIKAFCQAK
jgi:hypothetical protein